MDHKNLVDIRLKLDSLDEQIVDLLKKRLDLVKSACDVKNSLGEGAYSHEREESILSHVESYAKTLSLPENYVKDLWRRILRESYKGVIGHFACTTDKNTKVVIVGGNGGMGQIFTRYFKSSDYDVISFEPSDWDRASEILKGAKIVIISVPIDVTLEVIKRLSPYLTEDMILCDLTSVKAPYVEAMCKYHKGPVLGLHPMFGPDVKSLVKQVIVSVPERFADKSAFLVEQFSLWGARLVKCDAKEHDEAMSIIQALRHFTTYAYGTFLSKENPSLKNILMLSSPIYRLELLMVGRLFAQNPRLYADIIMSSKKNFELIKAYAESIKPELEVIYKKDMETFIKRFIEARDYFGEYAQQFLKDSGALLAKFQDDKEGF